MANVKHDWAGRYLLPDPVTGEERAWTRATTFADTLADRYGLEQWAKRLVAKGIATRDDLRALAAATPLAEKKALNRVAQQALDAVAAKAGANVGTALHEWTAQVDKSGVPTIPHPWNTDIAAYVGTLSKYGVTTHPGLVERIVCLPELGVAGTFDRIVEWSGEMWIADVKTQADLDWSQGSIAIQEALYARAPYAWDEEREEWGPNQPVNWVKGMVFHLPAGQARCEILWCDIDYGWRAVELANGVREHRKRRDLLWPIGVDYLGRSPLQAVPDLAGPNTAEDSQGGGGGEALDRSAPLSAPVGESDPPPPTESLFEQGDPAYD